MPLIAIYNPVCGNGTAKVFFDNYVLPLLSQHGKPADKLIATVYPGHAGQIIVDFLESVQGDITIILGSGDGTLHEIINFLSSATFKGQRAETPLPRLLFVLVPCGTANALYSSLFPPTEDVNSTDYRLQSVQSFIHSSATVPLTLAIAMLSPPPNVHKPPQVAISSVVVSTSLHASILRDSESLRKDMSGIERFKVAAKNNGKKWYNSYVKLLPAPASGIVHIYNPATGAFSNHPESDENDPIVDLYGPFIYFLSTVNVDRLEHAFIITPLARKAHFLGPFCDVLIIRPLRDPSLSWDNVDAREAFERKLWDVLGAVYKEGEHINLRYRNDGEIVSVGDGPVVVEYIRCGGWEWVPDDLDDDAHLLCSDGALWQIEKGGRAICSTAVAETNRGFAVYV